MAALVGYLEAHDQETMTWVRERCLAGESFVSPRFGVGISAALQSTPVVLPSEHLSRYLVHLVERKFLALGPSYVARLVALAVLPRLLSHYLKVYQLMGVEPSAAFWCAVELVEGEIFAHVAGLDGLFEAFESTTEVAAAALGGAPPPEAKSLARTVHAVTLLN